MRWPAGGCTFAADPTHDCARAAYLWTADVDAHVLRARLFPVRGPDEAAIDLTRIWHCVRRRNGCAYVRLALPDGALRLDIVAGELEAGPLLIEPSIDLRRALAPQLATVARLDRLCRGAEPPSPERRFIHIVEALRAADALAAGASLREIGRGTLGGDWPGDGEHAKSLVRRRIALAGELLRAGPLAVLSLRI